MCVIFVWHKESDVSEINYYSYIYKSYRLHNYLVSCVESGQVIPAQLYCNIFRFSELCGIRTSYTCLCGYLGYRGLAIKFRNVLLVCSKSILDMIKWFLYPSQADFLVDHFTSWFFFCGPLQKLSFLWTPQADFFMDPL